MRNNRAIHRLCLFAGSLIPALLAAVLVGGVDRADAAPPHGGPVAAQASGLPEIAPEDLCRCVGDPGVTGAAATKLDFLSRYPSMETADPAQQELAWDIYRTVSRCKAELVIGRLEDVREAVGEAGTCVMSDFRDWTPTVNDAFIWAGIDRGARFRLMSAPPQQVQLAPGGDAPNQRANVYNRELSLLRQSGHYQLDGPIESAAPVSPVYYASDRAPAPEMPPILPSGKVLVGDFLDIVRQRLRSAEGDGVWSDYFRVAGDREHFLDTVRGYINGVAVDPEHLGSGVNSDQGITQPRGWNGFWRIGRGDESYEYIGHIVLRSLDPSNVGDRATALHEAIHAYSLASGGGELDADIYGGPEFLSAAFIDVMVPRFIRAELALEGIVTDLQQCVPDAPRLLDNWWSDLASLRYRYESIYENRVITRLAEHMGGALDWDGYERSLQAHIDGVIETRDCLVGEETPAELLDGLRSDVDEFERRVVQDNEVVERAIALRDEFLAAQDTMSAAMARAAIYLGGMAGQIEDLRQVEREWFAGDASRSRDIMFLAGYADQVTGDLARAMTAAGRAGANALQTRELVCGQAVEPGASADEAAGLRADADERIEQAALATVVALQEIEVQRETLTSIVQELREPAEDAAQGAAVFRLAAVDARATLETANADFVSSRDALLALSERFPAAVGMSPQALVARVSTTTTRYLEIDKEIDALWFSGLSERQRAELDLLEARLRGANDGRTEFPGADGTWWKWSPTAVPLVAPAGGEWERDAGLLNNAERIAARFDELVAVARQTIDASRNAAQGAVVEGLAADAALDEARACAQGLVPPVSNAVVDEAEDETAGEEEDDTAARGFVPNVLGMPIEEAYAIVARAGFLPVIEVGAETSEPAREGTVSRQGGVTRAGDGTPVRFAMEPGSKVVLEVYVMATAGMVVPDLVGETAQTALAMVTPSGADSENRLFINFTAEGNAPRPSDEGRVIRQYPEPGLEVPRGTAIDVWVYGNYVEPAREPDSMVVDGSRAVGRPGTARAAEAARSGGGAPPRPAGPLGSLEPAETLGRAFWRPSYPENFDRTAQGWRIPADRIVVGTPLLSGSRGGDVHHLRDQPLFREGNSNRGFFVSPEWAERGDAGTIACTPDAETSTTSLMGNPRFGLRFRSPRAQVAVTFISMQPVDWPAYESTLRAYAERLFEQIEAHAKPCR